MRYVETAGTRVSAIGLGCWQFGSRDWGYGTKYAQRTAVDLVHGALDLGVNLVDTAEVYAHGVSETIVGRALEGRRSEAFLATKVLPVWPTASRVEEHGRLSALRLGVDVIDLYQVHWPNPVVPLSTQMEGMRRLLDAGLVRHAGVSNFSVKRWAAAEHELGRAVLSNQVQFSLLASKPSTAAVPYAQERDRLVIAYSPLAKGLLGGRYGPDSLPAASARRMDPLWLPDNVRRAMPVIETVKRIADAHAATPAQVALAWVIQHPNTVAIPGARSVEQLRHNAEAADLDLKEGEIEELDAEAARFEPIGKPSTAREMLRAARRSGGDAGT
jgi:aryl-alcohol dehydrogenase-like predicted oxidoreductase